MCHSQVGRFARRIIALAAVATIWHAAAELRAQGPPGAARVVVAPVVEREVQAGQTFVGSVMPARESEIGSAVDGRVVAYPVREGDYVQKDQPLAQLLTGLLEIEKRYAEAERDLRRQELIELEHGARPEEIERARAQLASRKALADYAKTRLQRLQRLTQQGTITEDEIQDAVSRAQQTDQLFQEAKADHDMALRGPRVEQIDQAKARLAMAEESVHRIEDQLIKHTIKAPFNGYVVREYTQVGAWVAKAGLVAKVIELEEVDVTAEVLETYLPFIREGMEARVEIPALPNKILIGQVFRIVPQADVRSRTFPVKIRLKNEIDEKHLPLIKAGMFARASLPVGNQGKALLVPKDAIVLGGSSIVYVVDAPPGAKEGAVRPVPVQLGACTEDHVEVTGNLKPGEKVVVRGNERLFPGTKVSFN